MKHLAKDLMTKTVHSVTPETSLQDIVSLFRKADISAAPVVDAQGKWVGVISKTNLLNAYIEKKEKGVVKDVMTKETCTVGEEEPLAAMAQRMFEKKIHHVFVVRERKLTGVVSSFDALKCYPLLEQLERFGEDSVKKIMKTKVITISPTEKLSRAVELMEEHRIRQLPVVKNGKLEGIVTDRDIRKAQISQVVQPDSAEENAYYMETILVGEIMTKTPITIGPMETIRGVALKLRNNKIGSLPILEDGRQLVGIVTQSDILTYLIQG